MNNRWKRKKEEGEKEEESIVMLNYSSFKPIPNIIKPKTVI